MFDIMPSMARTFDSIFKDMDNVWEHTRMSINGIHHVTIRRSGEETGVYLGKHKIADSDDLEEVLKSMGFTVSVVDEEKEREDRIRELKAELEMLEGLDE